MKKSTAPYCRPRTAVVRCRRISRDARFLYVILRSYARNEDSCFPSIDTLAADMGANRKSICRWLRELEQERVMKRQPRTEGALQRSNLYLLDDDHFARFLAKTMGQKSTSRGGQKSTTKEKQCTKGPATIIPFPKKA